MMSKTSTSKSYRSRRRDARHFPGPSRAAAPLNDIDEQVATVEKAVAGEIPVKRNQFIQLADSTRKINPALEAKTQPWSIRKFVRTARRCRTIEIHVGTNTVTDAEPIADDFRQGFEAILRTQPTCALT
jgi:hypothetical protein